MLTKEAIEGPDLLRHSGLNEPDLRITPHVRGGIVLTLLYKYGPES